MENINKIIIAFIIILSTVLIGTPLEQKNVQIVYLIINIYCLICMIKKTIKKEKANIDKMDIVIFVFAFSSFIPLIFGKNISVSENVYGIIKYTSLFNVYGITKDEIRKDNKYANILINTIIASILLLCIIGLDEINGNYLKELKKIIGYRLLEYDEVRISSLFSYPNTMALVAGIGILLSAGKILSENKIKAKIIYGITTVIFFSTFILTYSRLAYIIFTIILLMILSAIAVKYKIHKKINKKIVCISIILGIAIISYIVVGLNLPKEVEIQGNYQKILYKIMPNTEYSFEFEIENLGEPENNLNIQLTQKDKYFDEIAKEEKKFSTNSGKNQIKVKTQENAQVIYLNIKLENAEDKIKIKNFKINNEEFILEYKILPTNIVGKIKNIDFSNKSAWERIVFIQDGLKIAKNNWLLGLGTNSWREMQKEVQEYSYYAQEMHCFPIQILVENGVVGFLSVIGIFVIVIQSFTKEVKKEKLESDKISIVIAIAFILIYSCLDFHLSFFYVLLILLTLLAIITSNEKTKELKKCNIIKILIITVSIINIYISSLEMYYYKDIEALKVNSIWTEERIYDTYSKLLPTNLNIKVKKYQLAKEEKNYEKMLNIIGNLLRTEKYLTNNINLEMPLIYLNINKNNQREIEFIFNYVKETEKANIYEPQFQIIRLKRISQMIDILEEQNNKEYAKKFEEQLKKEIDEKEEKILDYEKARYDKKMVEGYERELKEIKEILNLGE